MPPSDKTVLLGASPAFAMLERAVLAEIAAAASLSRPGGSNDDFLFRAGDAAEGLFLIASDRDDPRPGPAVQVSFGERHSAAAKVGYRLFEGELAGDIEFLMSGLSPALPARAASARALRPLIVVHIPSAAVETALKASEAFRRRLVRDASRRLAGLLAEKAAENAAHPEVRLAEGMLGLLDDYGHVVANKGVFAARLTQQEIADRLGMSRRLFSLRCSDWSARGLIETSPFCLPDIRRLERIAGFGRMPVREAMPEAIEAVETMIARGFLAQASQAATDALAVFPGNPVLAYLLALAGARMGAGERAAQILAAPSLAWDGSIAAVKTRLRHAWARSLDTRHLSAADRDEDEEGALHAFFEARLNVLAVDVGALHARLAKDHVETAADAVQRRAAACEAARLYREVHEARPNHYCAVNAASLDLIGGRRGEAEKLANEALRLAGRDQPGYWASASKGEALLLLGRADEAASAFAEALARPDADLAKTSATRRQVLLLSEAAEIGAAKALEALDPGRPIFFSGPLMTARDGTPEELEEAEKALEAALAGWLAGRRVPAAYCAAACGADILFAEAALEAGIPLHVVLPFSIDRFAELSVRIGEGWETRYLRCLDGAASVTELWRHEVPKGSLNHHFLRGNRHLAGETILAAHTLRTRPLMLAVLDGRRTASLAGSRHVAGLFAGLGHEVAIIASPFERRAAPAAAAGQGPFAPVVFTFARAQSENDGLADLLPGLGFATRMMKDKRLAGQKVCASWQEAFAAASLAARQASDGGLPLRVVCDYGPVLQRGGAVDADAVLKLEAAFDLTAAVFGDLFATGAFVMAELAEGGDPARYAPISVAVEQDPDAGTVVPRGARQIYRIAAPRPS